jgi:hypothetical protein
MGDPFVVCAGAGAGLFSRISAIVDLVGKQHRAIRAQPSSITQELCEPCGDIKRWVSSPTGSQGNPPGAADCASSEQRKSSAGSRTDNPRAERQTHDISVRLIATPPGRGVPRGDGGPSDRVAASGDRSVKRHNQFRPVAFGDHSYLSVRTGGGVASTSNPHPSSPTSCTRAPGAP